MNKKFAVISNFVAAFFIGVISGGLVIGYICGQHDRYLTRYWETIQISTDVTALNDIRSDNVTNAVEFLESDLDGSLMILGDYITNTPKLKLGQHDLETLRHAKKYRDKFPHTNDNPEINQAVSNEFLLVETNK